MAILVTGGAGYIGSHTCVELLTAGYDVVVVDNLYNSSEKALERVEKITGRKVKFYEADLLDQPALKEVFDKEDIDSVIHFAGLKAVGESVRKPLEYYHNNITGTLILCDEMRSHGSKILYSVLPLPCMEIRQKSPSLKLPQGRDYQSLRTDQGHAGADTDRLTYSGSGVERGAAALLQPHRRP